MEPDLKSLAEEVIKKQEQLSGLGEAFARTFDSMRETRVRALEAKARREAIIDKGARSTDRRRPL
jgi:hypothetical protein